MNDIGASVLIAPPPNAAAEIGSVHQNQAAVRRLKRRYAAERRFKLYGLGAIVTALGALAVLLGSIVSTGYTAFRQTNIRLQITFDPAQIAPPGTTDPAALRAGNYRALITAALETRFPDAEGRLARRQLDTIVSGGAEIDLLNMVLRNPALVGTTRPVWVLASSDIDMVVKGHVDRTLPETGRRVNDRQLAWLDALERAGDLSLKFNTRFFTEADSRYPELVGIWGGVVGSFYTLLVTLALAFPLGVMAAIYLEEFAARNRFTDIIEVNINNLAAVPSIIYGLLGLAVFLNVLQFPRSAPVVGGAVLALMSLPIIIIAARAALRAVPPSIREAALGLGASKVQMVTHHVLPLAMPGMLTGTIIAMAHALGETAPLLMIGMVAFIVGIPDGPFDPATVLPVQIFMWADSPERGYVEKTSAAIMVLLAFLLLMNATAIYLRRKFERRW